MHDVLEMRIGNNEQSWDIYTNQMLAFLKFRVSETTIFSPPYLLYNRDVILPLDNILRPRRIYNHEIALQEMPRTFNLDTINVKKAKRRAMDNSLAKN